MQKNFNTIKQINHLFLGGICKFQETLGERLYGRPAVVHTTSLPTPSCCLEWRTRADTF